MRVKSRVFRHFIAMPASLASHRNSVFSGISVMMPDRLTSGP
jgi:hypothetical protein